MLRQQKRSDAKEPSRASSQEEQDAIDGTWFCCLLHSLIFVEFVDFQLSEQQLQGLAEKALKNGWNKLLAKMGAL